MEHSLLLFFNHTLAHPLLDRLMLGLTSGAPGALSGLGAAFGISQQRRVGVAMLAGMVVESTPSASPAQPDIA